ncbi:MAG: hypothetical protein H7288_04615 [Kineosporiaceae bacterium]|nr:hypothetical protein [Aeromicrobium sp.]
METRVFLERGTCCVWISLIDDGSLRLSGQDLGGCLGADEYEYWITVHPQDFALIREALGAEPAVDIEDLMCANAKMIYSCGELTWLRSIAAVPDFANYF